MSGTKTDPLTTEATARRRFLRDGAMAALAAGTLAACRKSEAAPRTAAAPAGTHPGMTTPPAAPVSAASKAEDMDRMHEAGIKAFPAKTAGKGNQLMAPRLEDGVKVYELTAKEIDWEVEPGRKVKALA